MPSQNSEDEPDTLIIDWRGSRESKGIPLLALDLLLLTTSIAILGVLSAVGLVYTVRRRPTGNEKMVSIWRAIIEGANAYLKRQFMTLAVIAGILALIIVGGFSLNARF